MSLGGGSFCWISHRSLCILAGKMRCLRLRFNGRDWQGVRQLYYRPGYDRNCGTSGDGFYYRCLKEARWSIKKVWASTFDKVLLSLGSVYCPPKLKMKAGG